MDKEYGTYTAVTPPRGLFSRIISRLGLERELKLVRRHLGFFSAATAIFLFLSVFAFIGLKDVLAESNFGPFLALAFSDPSIVIKYWHSFSLSLFESIPGAALALLLLPLALLLLFVRFVSGSVQKFSDIMRSINKKQYGHK